MKKIIKKPSSVKNDKKLKDMQHPNDLVRNLGGKVVENTAKSILMDSKDPRKKQMASEVQIMLLILLLLVGAEGMKILLRTNFGSKSISMLRIGLCSLIFFLWGAIPLGVFIADFYENGSGFNTFLANSGGVFSMVIVAVFYWTLAFRVFSLGAKERTMSKVSNKFIYDSGDSVLFGYLMDKGVSKKAIQIGIEPLFVIGIGFLLGSFNLLLGLPIIVCGVSLILYQVYESIVVGADSIYHVLQTKGIYNDDNYSEVTG